jgi:uncharacterized phage infection (PIP) family protein YhgE
MTNESDFQQIQKRIEWLDNERRNDKTVIAALQTKLDALSSENAALQKRLNDIESETTRLNALMSRLEQFDLEINNIRTEFTKQVEDLKNAFKEDHLQTNRNQQKLNDMSSDMTKLRKVIHNIEEIDITNNLEQRQEEDIRLGRLIEELKVKINEKSHFDEEYKRSLRIIEENRQQDSKRLTDLQGEIASIRKRVDETRGKQDLVGDNVRKIDSRINDLLKAESERRESQTTFIEKINVTQVNRDRIFNEWSTRFDRIEAITNNLETQITSLENTNRSVKQSQAALDEVTQRFERRVNEITEVQRLNEDRFRQEWTTFKSDDQKRWSNYTISQDEQHREMNRSLENLGNSLSTMEDKLEVLQSTLQQLGRDEIKNMQNLLTSIRESIDDYKNIFKE